MSLALRLAALGRWTASPNPMVGAVVVADGVVVGRGHHQRAGGPHAEVVALEEAGERARGATLYVTLEPCSHQGRTPPCVEAVKAAGVAEVVACHRDPDPRVAGAGFAALRAAGIEVKVGVKAEQAVHLNLSFLTAQVHRRPAVTIKWAMSLDGKIATASGESQWISSPPARRWALALREEHDAILVGSGTALADDPRLTRRRGRAEGPIVRAVLDRRLRLPAAARMLAEAGPVLVYTRRLVGAEAEMKTAAAPLGEAGAEVVALPQASPAEVLADLHQRGVRSLLVEGGGEVTAAFVEAGLWDRVVVVLAPRLIGGRDAPGPVSGRGFSSLAATPDVSFFRSRRRGPDRILEGLRDGCLPALLQSLGA